MKYTWLCGVEKRRGLSKVRRQNQRDRERGRRHARNLKTRGQQYPATTDSLTVLVDNRSVLRKTVCYLQAGMRI